MGKYQAAQDPDPHLPIAIDRMVTHVGHAFIKAGGNLGSDGSVAYLFDKRAGWVMVMVLSRLIFKPSLAIHILAMKFWPALIKLWVKPGSKA